MRDAGQVASALADDDEHTAPQVLHEHLSQIFGIVSVLPGDS